MIKYASLAIRENHSTLYSLTYGNTNRQDRDKNCVKILNKNRFNYSFNINICDQSKFD